MFDFENVIGNENLIQSLKSTFKNNMLAHTYIFSGASGSGKKQISLSFCKLILCENLYLGGPCGKCESCLSIETGNNPDVIFIKNTKKSIGMETIRDEVLKQVYIKPFKFKYKIFIIQDSQYITIQAQNALLKVIETPPNYVKFFFLTQNYNYFLPTILSRAHVFNILPLPNYYISNLLVQKYQIEPKLAEICSIYSQGSIGQALFFSTINDFLNLRNNIILEIKNLLLNDLINLYNFINKLENYKDNIQYILDIFFFIYRDFLIFKNTKNLNLIFQYDLKDLIIEISQILSNKKLFKSIDNILIAKENLTKNSNFYMTMEYLFFKLKEK